MRSPLLFCLALCFASCQAAPQPTAPQLRLAQTADPHSPCALAREKRAQARELLQQGRLERTLRAIRRANALCPAEEQASWPEQLKALQGLEAWEDLRLLVARAEASPTLAQAEVQVAREALAQPIVARTPSQAWTLSDQALSSATDKDPIQSQRSKELGLAWLERSTGTRCRLASRLPPSETGNREGLLWSPDATRAVLLRNDALYLFDTKTWHLVQTLEGAETEPETTGFSNDGSLLIATGHKELFVWDIAQARKIVSLPDPGGFVLDRKHNRLLTGIRTHSLRLWELPSGRELKSFAPQPDSLRRAFFAPDGLIVSVGTEGTVRILDPDSGVSRANFVEQNLLSIEVSPDGKWLATGTFEPSERLPSSDFRGILRLREAQSGRLVRTLLVPDPPRYVSYAEEIYDVSTLVFSQDSRLIGTSNGQGFSCLWDLAGGRLLQPLPRRIARSSAPSGVVVSTIDADATPGTLRVISRNKTGIVETPLALAYDSVPFGEGLLGSVGEDELAIGHFDGTLEPVRFKPFVGRSVTTITPPLDGSPEGTKVAAFSDNDLRVWDRKTGAPLHREPLVQEVPSKVAFTRDGVLVTQSQQGPVQALDPAAPGSMLYYRGTSDDWLTHVGFQATSSGRILILVPEESRTRIVDLASNKQVAAIPVGHRSTRPPVLSEDGSTIALTNNAQGDPQHTTVVWSIARNEKVIDFKSTEPATALSREGRWFAALAPPPGSLFQIWDLASGAVLRNLPEGSKPVFAFSPTGEWFAYSRPREVVLTPLSEHGAERVLHAWEDSLTAVAFDPKGTTLAVAGRESGVHLLDVTTGRESLTLPTIEGTVSALAFSPRGVLAVATMMGRVHLFHRNTPIATLQSLPSEEGAVLTASTGAVELLGNKDVAARILMCRVGVWTLGFSACGDRFEQPGVLHNALRGIAAELE